MSRVDEEQEVLDDYNRLAVMNLRAAYARMVELGYRKIDVADGRTFFVKGDETYRLSQKPGSEVWEKKLVEKTGHPFPSNLST